MDRRLLMLALGMFALGTDSFVVAGVLPQIARSYEVSIGAAGQMTTVYAVAYALLAPTIAALAASVPRKRLLLAGMGVFMLANLATALAPSLALALLTRALAGLGAAMFSPTATGAAAMLVAPERRGFALSVVIAGLSGATALGSPAGALIGGLGDWRWTMVFVAALATVSALGVAAFLPDDIPMPPRVALAQRLAPLADARIGLVLLTTLLMMAGTFTIYTYFSVVFDRVIAGDPLRLGALLVLWGAAGTAANLLTGRLIDAIGSRRVVVTGLLALVALVAPLAWSGASLWTAVPVIALWGACGWGLLVPQQHRLVTMVPTIAPILLGLNTAATYLGVTAAGLVGAAGLHTVGAHGLGLIAVVPIGLALLTSELASRRIVRDAGRAAACA